jgi:hypothetical protein
VRRWLMVCALVCAGGCAENRQYFRPTEHVFGQTAHGYDEAIYQLVGPFGPFGEAKVWSPGGFHEHDQNFLRVILDLHNTSGVPIELDPQRVRLDPVRAGSALLRNIAPDQKQVVAVAAGAFGQVVLRFVLPADIRPGKVTGFGLRWQVRNGPQAYSQLTPFIEDRGRYAYDYPPTYGWGYGVYCTPYDPFCNRGAYGWGVTGARPIIVAPPPEPPRATIHVH